MQRYNQLYVRLDTKAQVRLDLEPYESASAPPESEQVTIMLPNGQVLRDCFWRIGSVDAAGALQKNEEKVRKLVRFMHDQSPSYYKDMVRWVSARLPVSFKQLSPAVLWGSNAVLIALMFVAYQLWGSASLLLAPMVTFYLWLSLLRYTHPDDALRYDYDAIEVAASAMLGFLPVQPRR